MKIGVMALQGAFIEHEQMLQQLGVDTIEIRQLSDWQQSIDALILPGGESTVQMHLLSQLGLMEPVKQAIIGGMPVFGTCAGMILLSESHLSTMAIRVRRNAYGRQLGSFHTEGKISSSTKCRSVINALIPMTFIRAPYIEEICSPEVDILAEIDGHIVAAQQGNQLVTAFHPELDNDTRLHEYFLRICQTAKHA